MGDFTVELSDFKAFRSFQKKIPKALNYASAGVLNALAFGSRTSMQQLLSHELTIRNRTLISAKLTYQRTYGTKPIASQATHAGSRSDTRFTGWAEQMGAAPRLNRQWRFAARRNRWQSKISAKFRLKDDVKFPGPNNQGITGGNTYSKAVATLNIMSRQPSGTPFVLAGHPKFSNGLYILSDGRGGGAKKPILIQKFKDPLKPKRNPWIVDSVKWYLRDHPVAKTWGLEIQRQMKMISGGKLK